MEKLLFVVTFIFGVIALLTKTKLFDLEISGFFDVLYWRKTPAFFRWLDVLIFLFSLGYQVNYWLL